MNFLGTSNDKSNYFPLRPRAVEGLFLSPDFSPAQSMAGAALPGEETVTKKKSPSEGLKMAFTGI